MVFIARALAVRVVLCCFPRSNIFFLSTTIAVVAGTVGHHELDRLLPDPALQGEDVSGEALVAVRSDDYADCHVIAEVVVFRPCLWP